MGRSEKVVLPTHNFYFVKEIQKKKVNMQRRMKKSTIFPFAKRKILR